jgi:hypothetical protein
MVEPINRIVLKWKERRTEMIAVGGFISVRDGERVEAIRSRNRVARDQEMSH